MPTGFPLFFHQVSRFETEAQAVAFVASYLATIDCSEWTIEAAGSGPDIVMQAEVVPEPSAQFGDETREITFDANAELLRLRARTIVIRSGTDVLVLSLTSVLATDLLALDDLAATAVERLDY